MWQKIKMRMAAFMQGRHGSDNFGMFLFLVGIACYIVSMITGLGIFVYLGLALYIWTIFRMFSRNNEKRAEENRRYIELTSNYKTRFKQFRARVKNRKEYKYFRCPKCRAMLRLTRGCGKVNVTCGRCQHEFEEKA